VSRASAQREPLRIGLTYDLKSDYLAQGLAPELAAEFDSPETIAAIERSLRALGHATERVGNVKQLVDALAAGKRWDLVFNIAEGLYGEARESQIPALLDAYRIPYTFSGPLVLALALDKGLTKRVVAAAGAPTPAFAVVPGAGTAWELCRQTGLDFPLFVKPLAEGTGKGVSGKSLVHDPRELENACAGVIERFAQPALVERFLPGREFTVGILGAGSSARALGVLEVLFNEQAQPEGYTYDNKQLYESRVEYRLTQDEAAREAAAVALLAWRALGCLDAGRVDLRADASGQPQFIEVNPLAGLHPVHSDLPILCRLAGIEYQELIREIVDQALARAGLTP
jgi:D-alanine-D-alanine ligase